MDISGLDLAERFFRNAVEPIIARSHSGLRYAAALIGPGSEVLGYDDVISRDHDWAPRTQIFLAPDDLLAVGQNLRALLDAGLPSSFGGYPVRIAVSDPGAGTRLHHPAQEHRTIVTSLPVWLNEHLGTREPRLSVGQWLSVPQQRLLEFTAGRVFRDDTGELADARRRTAWYPDDVWRYLLACQWQRVAQLEPFVGRTGDVGDELGSRLNAASLVRDAMRLAFLLERQYAPYAKWLGTAFQRLTLAPALRGDLEAAFVATSWRERESALITVFERLGHASNALELADAVDPSPRRFYDRPYSVPEAHRFRDALDSTIADPAVRAVIERVGWVGAVDQLSDSVDLLTDNDRIGGMISYSAGNAGQNRAGSTAEWE